MLQSLTPSRRLKPELRLAQAVSEFEAELPEEQKALFRAQRSLSISRPPEVSDVMQLTAMVDRCASLTQERPRSRCVGPRLTNFLQATQQYVALGDIVVGGAQNLIASGVWAVVRSSFLMIANHAVYLEKLSLLFMHAGRSAPRYQHIALLYPKSKELQDSLCEYFLVVVNICHKAFKFSRKSYLAQLKQSLSDADIKQYQTDLDTWASAIKDEVDFVMAQRFEDESRENHRFQTMIKRFTKTSAYREKLMERLQILDACSTFDHQTLWKQARKIGNTRLLIESPQYEQWRNSTASHTLVCTGKLGSGKSVMLANIVDDLNIHAQSTVLEVAYFFCRHDIPESLLARTIIGSLIRQLLAASPSLAPFQRIISGAVTAHGTDLDELIEYFYHNFSSRSKLYFILDGLDECSESEQRIVLTSCRNIQQRLRLNICISFRLEADKHLKLSEKQLMTPIIFTIPEENPEITSFINSELQERIVARKLNIGDPAIILEIHEALLKGSQGMFLWVALQIDSLCAEKTDEKIRDALMNIPKTLSETFSRILDRADEHDKTYQRQILEIVAVAYRPLVTEELQEALGVVPGVTDWNPSTLINDMYSVLACCGSLIVVDEEDCTVRLIHHSVRQYLFGGLEGRGTPYLDIEEADRRMGHLILTYLNYNVFNTQLSRVVIPSVDSHGAPKKIIKSIDGPRFSQDMALKLLAFRTRPNQADSSYNLGNQIAKSHKKIMHQPSKRSFMFHQYAKIHWLFHTKSTRQSDEFSYRALQRLLNDSDLSSVIKAQTGLLSSQESRSSGFSEYRNHEIPKSSSSLQLSLAPQWALKNSHLLLLRHLLRPKTSLKTVSSLYISMKRLISLPCPPRWHKEVCGALLPLSLLNSSDWKATRFLLNHGAPISLAIEAAILSGDLLRLQLLISRFDSLDEIQTTLNSFDFDAIKEACIRENPELVSFLAFHGANVKRVSEFSPLLWAIYRAPANPSWMTAVRDLHAFGATLSFDDNPEQPWRLASYLVDVEAYDLFQLTKRFLSPDHLKQILFKALCRARESPVWLQQARDFLAAGVTPSFNNAPGQGFILLSILLDIGEHGVFQRAVRSLPLGHLQQILVDCWHRAPHNHTIASYILKMRDEPKASDPQRDINCLSTIIHQFKFDETLVTNEFDRGPMLLMRSTHNIEHHLSSRQSAILSLSVCHGLDRRLIRLAIDKNALLHQRVKELDLSQVDFMCGHGGADIDSLDSNGQTPLMVAMSNDFLSDDYSTMVLAILAKGAYPNCLEEILVRITCSPGDMNFHHNSAEIIRIARALISFGAEIQVTMIEYVIEVFTKAFLLYRHLLEVNRTARYPPMKPKEHLDGQKRQNSDQSYWEDPTLSLQLLLQDMLTTVIVPPNYRLTLVLMLCDSLNFRDPKPFECYQDYFARVLGLLTILATHTPPLETQDEIIFLDLKEDILEYLKHILDQEDSTIPPLLAYSILKHGRECHGSISLSSCQNIIELGISVAISKGDVESTISGVSLIEGRYKKTQYRAMIIEAEEVWQQLNEAPVEGRMYELEG